MSTLFFSRIKLIRPGDIIVILLGIGLTAAGFLNSLDRTAPGTVQINWDGKILVYPLDEERILPLDGPQGHNLIIIDGQGNVNITEADCADQLCMNMGPISRTGQYMACLPHRLFITIKGEEDTLVDTELW